MTGYLQRLETTPEPERWPLARGWLFEAAPFAFYAELRAHRPVLPLGPATLVTRFDDCAEILRRHEVFSVQPYAAKQGDYWMAQDDTPRHWREKSVMRAILDREDLPAIRAWVAEEAARRLEEAGPPFDAVKGLTRAVPLELVRRWFGFEDGDPEAMERWSYWNQIDAFWNQPFDLRPDFDEVVAKREAANAEMREYLVDLVRRRAGELKAGKPPEDPVSRLLVLAGSGAVRLDVGQVVLNVGGLLIGAVETTSHAVVNALSELFARPEALAAARAAAAAAEPAEALDAWVFEALRFRPAFRYFFRRVERPVSLARGTDHETALAPGSMVLAVTHSAMFDGAAYPAPDRFDPTRALDQSFTFGHGLHQCLGRAVAGVMVPEIVRQALKLEGLEPEPVDRRGGPVPESWIWRWGCGRG